MATLEATKMKQLQLQYIHRVVPGTLTMTLITDITATYSKFGKPGPLYLTSGSRSRGRYSPYGRGLWIRRRVYGLRASGARCRVGTRSGHVADANAAKRRVLSNKDVCFFSDKSVSSMEGGLAYQTIVMGIVDGSDEFTIITTTTTALRWDKGYVDLNYITDNDHDSKIRLFIQYLTNSSI